MMPIHMVFQIIHLHSPTLTHYNQNQPNIFCGFSFIHMQESCASWPLSYRYSPNNLTVIINADDYGYCRERNQGIIELIQSQAISSVSVIINAENIEQQAQRLLKVCQQMGGKGYKISIGLHFNLTEFQYVANDQKVIHDKSKQAESLLYNLSTKVFHGKSYFYNNLHHLLNPRVLNVIAMELQSQIHKFTQLFRMRPSHIDGHNHIHVVPEIAQIISSKCPLYGIYCVRLPIPLFRANDQSQKLNRMNKLFIENARKSQHYFRLSGMISCQYMIGLEEMGSQFTCQKIEQQLMRIDRGCIEVMCHPGYKQSQSLCPFSGSIERQQEMEILKSMKFKTMIEAYTYKCTYYDLKNEKQSSCNAMIYSKLLEGSGNLTTSLRIKTILKQQGPFQHIYLLNLPEKHETSQKSEIDNLRRMIINHHIRCIIGVNITKTAQIIYEATRYLFKYNGNCMKLPIPYYLIVAGTDVNVSLVRQGVSQKMEKSIQHCQGLICLSMQMNVQMQKLLNEHRIKQTICVIQQSFNAANHAMVSLSMNVNRPYILMLTSFRKVKAVDHVLKQLNQLIDQFDISMLIFGPIIDRQYFDEIKQKLGKVVYLGTVAHQQSLEYLSNCLFLINSSESQGMSCAILQAFGCKVPVIARNNPGNCELITHGCNGFIYQSGQQFKQLAIKLIESTALRQQIAQQANNYLHAKFSYKQQRSSYQQLLNQYSSKYFDVISSTSRPFKLITIPGVHRTSPINLAILNKIFQNEHSLQQLCSILSTEQEGDSLNLLDMGCGNGVFAIYFIFKLLFQYIGASTGNEKSLKSININVTFIDAYQLPVCNTILNLEQLHRIFSQYATEQSHICYDFTLQSTTVLQSNMFQQLKNQQHNKFDIILANLPQSPFLSKESMPDKNGGADGFKLYRQLFMQQRKYIRNQQSLIVLLYSYLVDNLHFQQSLKQHGCDIVWKSQPETHVISKESYEQMQTGLADRISDLILKKRVQVSEIDGKFHVPAQIRMVKNKKIVNE